MEVVRRFNFSSAAWLTATGGSSPLGSGTQSAARVGVAVGVTERMATSTMLCLAMFGEDAEGAMEVTPAQVEGRGEELFVNLYWSL